MTMKRKVLCVFSLILLVLAFCTLLCPKAEREMQTLVRLQMVSGSKLTGRDHVTVPIVTTEWRDSRQLFCVVDGSGWESGLRVAEIPERYYTLVPAEDRIYLGVGTDYRMILTASRTPAAGDGVAVIQTPQKGPDTYLVLCADPITKPEHLSSVGQPIYLDETRALVQMKRAYFPFFEHWAKNSLKNIGASDMRIYSMSDTRQFLQALPWIAGILLVLVCSLILWGWSCILARRKENGRLVIWINAILSAVMVFSLEILLGRFDLPASFMPDDHILNLDHYIQQLQQIFGALNQMDAREILELRTQVLTQSVLIFSVGLIAVAAVIAAEVFFCRRNRKKRCAAEAACTTPMCARR